MARTRSQYKSLLRSKKIQYDDTQTKKLNQLKVKNAKEYWKLLKNASCNYTEKSNVSIDTFWTYFKYINSPDYEFYQPEEDVIVFNERYVQGEFIVMFDELNASISNDEILKACSQVNNGKSGGPTNF